MKKPGPLAARIKEAEIIPKEETAEEIRFEITGHAILQTCVERNIALPLKEQDPRYPLMP